MSDAGRGWTLTSGSSETCVGSWRTRSSRWRPRSTGAASPSRLPCAVSSSSPAGMRRSRTTAPGGSARCSTSRSPTWTGLRSEGDRRSCRRLRRPFPHRPPSRAGKWRGARRSVRPVSRRIRPRRAARRGLRLDRAGAARRRDAHRRRAGAGRGRSARSRPVASTGTPSSAGNPGPARPTRSGRSSNGSCWRRRSGSSCSTRTPTSSALPS